MGRRALRKTDPNIDLTGFLYTVDALPKPLTSAGFFGREAPLEIEVGSGKGLFVRSAAAARPDVNFLGIEIAHKYAQFAAVALAKRGLRNGAMIDGDALRVFSEYLPADSLAAVHVYFPDPWWKKRHQKRRVMKGSFLTDIERTLVPGGTLHFWTDVEEYFRETIALLKQTTRLEGPLEVPERPPEHDMDYRTHFERRMRKHDEPVFRSEFRKTAAPIPAPATK